MFLSVDLLIRSLSIKPIAKTVHILLIFFMSSITTTPTVSLSANAAPASTSFFHLFYARRFDSPLDSSVTCWCGDHNFIPACLSGQSCCRARPRSGNSPCYNCDGFSNWDPTTFVTSSDEGAISSRRFPNPLSQFFFFLIFFFFFFIKLIYCS